VDSCLVFKQTEALQFCVAAKPLKLLPDWVEWLRTSLSPANPLLHSVGIYEVKSTHMYRQTCYLIP